jgi:hypothetical protein
LSFLPKLIPAFIDKNNMMTANKAHYVLLFILCISYVANGSWAPVNPLREDSLGSISSTSQRVELGNNGRRMAVATSDNSIAIYDLDDEYHMSWKLAVNLNGVSGKHFSLSPDGQFLASRHESNAKQVQVWEILQSNENTVSSSSGNNGNIPSVAASATATTTIKNIGTLWCIADGEHIKLGQTSTRLYLSMSCETYLSNRGKVQFFVRDLSSSDSTSNAWNTFLPSLVGRNTGDMFGAAVSIAEAPSQYSPYSFRVAIGCPGFNENQGLVLIYTASDTTSTGWEQMGDDLTGKKIGEAFGSTLDISGDVNGQPFLLVGSPGWMKDKSIGSGLVRLYHWRKPASSFRAPRRWTLVGDPMTGPNNGIRFGSVVMISRNAERVAIAVSTIEGRYVAVYERQSYDSWGQIVNNVIFSGQNSSNDEMNQFFALNDQGSMVSTAMSEGTVQAFFDSSSFCGIPDLETPNTDDVTVMVQEVSVFETLLDRLTCRNGDDLIGDRNLCSEQSVFIRGEYQACLEKKLSITDSPSMVPSSSPTGGPTTSPSGSPSGKPSSSPSSAPSDSPSELPSGNNFPSSAPLDSPTKSAAPSASPSAAASANQMEGPTTSPIVNPTTAPSTVQATTFGFPARTIIPLATNKDTASTSPPTALDELNESATSKIAGTSTAALVVALIVVVLCG